MNAKVVLWDFDGVFVHTFNAALQIMQAYDPTLTEEEYRKRFEGNINDANKNNPTPPDEVFFQQYEAALLSTPLTPRIDEALRTISTSYPCLIVSSTITKPIQHYLDQQHLSPYITKILGNDVSKSKLEKFQSVVKEYRTAGSHCILITDTLGDIKEAKKANLRTIGVTWGFHPLHTLQKGDPDVLVHEPFLLTETVNKLLEEG